jgi:hypothetical protein
MSPGETRHPRTHPDNDSALVNDLLWDWTQQERIRLLRSRPYKKNDNAWVEQKNWTHVRKVAGYRRHDTTSELRVLNEIYNSLRLYKNFCLPTLRLKSKTRVEGRANPAAGSRCRIHTSRRHVSTIGCRRRLNQFRDSMAAAKSSRI